MAGFPVLTLMTFLPLAGVAFLLLLRGEAESVARNARLAALYTALAVFGLSLYAMVGYDPGGAAFQFVEKHAWMPQLGISYHMGIDGISLFFVVLSAFLTPVCILASWGAVKERVREYMIAFLVLETFMIGTFCALDAILFYVFFEGVLIPMFIIIGVWGGMRRIYAAFKFFLYTLLGSVLMLVALLALYYQAGTTDITVLMENPVARNWQLWLWLAFFASFAVKMPMWPVHTWLPDAHVEAPTAGSVILAGVLLKMGGYGFLRFSVPMMPEATAFYTDIVLILSVVAIIYTSLVALVQEDMKKLIAYSSVAHMGFVTLGIFTVTVQGVEGALFQMLSHGLISAALFLCVGVVYDRLHTREISRYGGIVKNMPRYATVFMIFMLGSVGLPGTSGFVGEFLTLVGAFQVNTYIAVLATTGIVLGAAYMLSLYRRVVFGPQVNADAAAMPDLSARELVILAPIAALVLVLGVAPGYVMERIAPSAQRTIALYQKGLEDALARQGQETARGVTARPAEVPERTVLGIGRALFDFSGENEFKPAGTVSVDSVSLEVTPGAVPDAVLEPVRAAPVTAVDDGGAVDRGESADGGDAAERTWFDFEEDERTRAVRVRIAPVEPGNAEAGNTEAGSDAAGSDEAGDADAGDVGVVNAVPGNIEADVEQDGRDAAAGESN